MTWEDIFKRSGKFFYKPHPEIARVLKLMREQKVKKVLDLGCGTGRHTVLLARSGFEVFGLDNAPSGLKQCKEWLKEVGVKAKLVEASCYERLPYKDNFFDALISVQVIHHARLKEIKRCIKEIERVVKPGGVVFITVTKNKMKGRASKVKVIAPRTYVMLDGFEKGVPHYIYNKKLLREYFSNFKILDITLDDTNHYCLLALKK